MNLRQIEVFHAVYSEGSISAASRLLNVSQPSVSKIVKHAETRLGFQLFRLVKGRLVATEEAHVLFRDVHELYERIGTFQQTARNLKSCAEGRIRIGLLPSLALSVAPEAVARFRLIAPRANFEISTVHHESFRNTLTARECDLVVGHHLLQGPEVQSVSLGMGRVGALFRRSLMPEMPDTIDGLTLRDHDIISLAPSVAISKLVDPVLQACAANRIRTIEVRTVYIAAALARQGVGLAIVDEFTARGIMTPDLCFRPIEPAVSFELKALHLAEQPLSRLTRSFLDVMRRIIARSATATAGADEDMTPYPVAMGFSTH
jgi:DNA-binding transcriptional LysR family regulator